MTIEEITKDQLAKQGTPEGHWPMLRHWAVLLCPDLMRMKRKLSPEQEGEVRLIIYALPSIGHAILERLLERAMLERMIKWGGIPKPEAEPKNQYDE